MEIIPLGRDHLCNGGVRAAADAGRESKVNPDGAVRESVKEESLPLA